MEKVLYEILGELKNINQRMDILEKGQANLEKGQAKLGKDITEMRSDIKDLKNNQEYIWDDIKRIDNRLTAQEAETFMLKRIK